MGVDRLDAAETIWFERELEQKKAQVFEKKYPQFKGRDFVPVETNYDPGVDTVTYEMLDQVGIAKVVSNYAKDIPRADVKATEHSAKIKTIADSYGYTTQDIRRARYTGKPLDQRKANAARRGILQKDENIIALGEADHGLVGLLNQPNIPIISAVDIGGGVTEWTAKTDEQILNDLNLFASTIRGNTNGIEAPNTLLLPPSRFTLIAQKRLGDTQVTILQWFLQSQQWIRDVGEWHFLETAGVGGVKRALGYYRDIDYLEHPLPVDANAPVMGYWEGLEYVQPMDARVGGVICRYPLSAVYMDEL